MTLMQRESYLKTALCPGPFSHYFTYEFICEQALCTYLSQSTTLSALLQIYVKMVPFTIFESTISKKHARQPKNKRGGPWNKSKMTGRDQRKCLLEKYARRQIRADHREDLFSILSHF